MIHTGFTEKDHFESCTSSECQSKFTGISTQTENEWPGHLVEKTFLVHAVVLIIQEEQTLFLFYSI